MSVVVFELDRTTAAELHKALDAHGILLRRNGFDLPQPLRDLDRIASSASERPATPILAADHDAPDAGVMALALTYTDAATALSVSPRTLTRMIKSRELPTVTIGGARRVRRVDLDAYLSGRPANGAA